MSERIVGKTFSTPEAAGLEPLTPEQIEAYLGKIDEAQRERDSIPDDQRRTLGPKFWDDTSGTDLD